MTKNLKQISLYRPDPKNDPKYIHSLIDSGKLEIAENEIKNIYRSGKKHFTNEDQLNKNNGLFEVYDRMYEVSKNTGMPSNPPKEVFKKLSDPEYISKLQNKSNILEEFFKSKYKINIDRLNKFVFRFEPNNDYEENTEDITKKFNNKVQKRSCDVINNLGGSVKWISKNFNTIPINTFKLADNIIKSQNINRKKFTNVIGMTILLQNFFIDPKSINSGMSASDIEINHGSSFILPKKKMLKPVSRNHINKLKEFLSSKYKNILSADPNSVKNQIIKFVDDKEDFSDMEYFFKSIENTSIIPSLNYIYKHGYIPNFITSIEGKSFMKLLKNCSESMFNMLSPISNMPDKYIYISNNPIDFLTLGHDCFLDSCQCLTKNGNLNIDENNANVIQSYNLDTFDDFIMFTGNSQNNNSKKTARITLSQDKDKNKFINYEGYKIYGQLEKNTSYLKNVIKNMMGKNIEKNPNIYISNHINSLKKTLFPLFENQIINLVENKLLDSSNSIEFNLMKPDDYLNSDNFKSILKQEQNSIISSNFTNEKWKSFNYNSPLYRAATDSEFFEDNLNNIHDAIKPRIYKIGNKVKSKRIKKAGNVKINKKHTEDQ